MAKPFHLGWFNGNGVGVYGWNSPWGVKDAREFYDPDYWIDFVRMLEKGCFDLFIFEDSSYVPSTYGGSHDIYVRNAMFTPKLDPAPYVPLIARATKNIGVICTCSTAEYPPYLLARMMNTLDHISNGRVGWNIVTGSNNLSAQNYGDDTHMNHDERYAMTDEYVELVSKLWGSWDPDALVVEDGVFADGGKVHEINFEGKYLRSRGPLNSHASPQGKPVFLQAGGSPAGRDFAAKNADAIVANPRGIDTMKEYTEDIRKRTVAHGRKESDVKLMFMLNPIIAETESEAQAIYERMQASGMAANPHIRLAGISAKSGIDFSQYDMDSPLPELTTNGHQATLEDFLRAGGPEIDRDKTLRQIIKESGSRGNTSLDIVGTPDSVAAQMGEAMEEIGADGYLLTHTKLTRRYTAELVDGLVPALQKRGLMREGYSHATLRENLLEF